MKHSRTELLALGQAHIAHWCFLNSVDCPQVIVRQDPPDFKDCCAYYRNNRIDIWPDRCSMVGNGVRSWSYPGYSTDRTPYGVLAHELGHHVDHAHGRRGGVVAHQWRKDTQEKPLTGYDSDNDNEWFAEIFRLFVTNPQLLWKLRSKMFDKLQTKWPHFAEKRRWEDVLYGAEPWIRAVRNKIK